MIEPWKIIEELESDNSRLFKEGVIEKHLNDKTFQEGLVMCLDPCLLYTSPSPRDAESSRMPSSA